MKNILLLSLLIISFSSCKKGDEPTPVSNLRTETTQEEIKLGLAAQPGDTTVKVETYAKEGAQPFYMYATVVITGTEYKYISETIRVEALAPTINNNAVRIHIPLRGLRKLEGEQKYKFQILTYRTTRMEPIYKESNLTVNSSYKPVYEPSTGFNTIGDIGLNEWEVK